MSVTAIAVNYGTPELFPGLIRNLRQEALITQIIVVDNSDDLRFSSCPDWMSGVETISNSSNVGFGAAVNQACGIARGKWILVINPDVLLEPGCVELLVDALIRFRLPLAGPRFYWDDDHVFRIPPATGTCMWVDYAGAVSQRFWLDATMYSFMWIMRHDRFWSATQPFMEPFLSGACLLIDKTWIDDGGGNVFDERFFLYYEDTDLCARAMRDGKPPICVPDATAIHYYNQSPSPGRSKYQLMEESHRFFAEKYYTAVFPETPPPVFLEPIQDIGELSVPPIITDFYDLTDTQYVEIGVNPAFVPFAQAEATTAGFVFPEAVWNRLEPGPYFLRIRDRIKGVKRIVTWKKSG